MNDLKVVAGEVFKGNVSGNKFQILSVEGEFAYILDIVTGNKFPYGVKALKHLAVTPIKEGDNADRQ